MVVSLDDLGMTPQAWARALTLTVGTSPLLLVAASLVKCRTRHP